MLKTWQKKFQLVHFNNLTPKSNGNFANRETCSFMRLNDAFGETLLKAGEKTRQEPSSLINSQLETRDSLSTAVYSVNIN